MPIWWTVAKIYDFIKKVENSYDISKQHIFDILHYMRKIISKYIEDVYKLQPIAFENGNDSLSINESLFVFINNMQKWVVGIINNHWLEIILEIVDNRTAKTIKNIISKFNQKVMLL